jgi:hypothetical protein
LILGVITGEALPLPLEQSLSRMTEQELREQIAKEIEAQIESLSLGDGLFKSGMLGAVAIVRGKND